MTTFGTKIHVGIYTSHDFFYILYIIYLYFQTLFLRIILTMQFVFIIKYWHLLLLNLCSSSILFILFLIQNHFFYVIISSIFISFFAFYFYFNDRHFYFGCCLYYFFETQFFLHFCCSILLIWKNICFCSFDGKIFLFVINIFFFI